MSSSCLSRFLYLSVSSSSSLSLRLSHSLPLSPSSLSLSSLCLSLSEDDMSYDLLTSVQTYAGYVDANCLIYLWPKEFDHCRICFVSGPYDRPIFSCFLSEVSRDKLIFIMIIVVRMGVSALYELYPWFPHILLSCFFSFFSTVSFLAVFSSVFLSSFVLLYFFIVYYPGRYQRQWRPVKPA
jgi:hypothetical protein